MERLHSKERRLNIVSSLLHDLEADADTNHKRVTPQFCEVSRRVKNTFLGFTLVQLNTSRRMRRSKLRSYHTPAGWFMNAENFEPAADAAAPDIFPMYLLASLF